ncbi:DUF1919 domain-containing protein [Cohnella yongneupensis]|uniref:DUF1919 domain-containing protein n=1 Tax=Cohnella yongneupensis TaxID=425006 RepID=A0ABW0QZF6_9BACL
MPTYKCIVWGVGLDYDLYLNAVKHQERLGNIEIVGVTSNQSIYSRVDGYRFIPKEELKSIDFDLLIIASLGSFNAIRQDAIGRGIDARKLVSIKLFALPELDLDKYLAIKNGNLTIFSNNCWGGITYNRLGMEFLSPFINMFVNTADYLKIMSAPRHYLGCEPTLTKYLYESELKREYPVCRLDDTELYFNHYATLEDAVTKWNSRKAKINWDNLFVMMFTENFEDASRFIELPYENKVCFVPFETTETALLTIDYARIGEMEKVPFWAIVNGLASGMYKYYDMLDLLQGSRNRNRI